MSANGLANGDASVSHHSPSLSEASTIGGLGISPSGHMSIPRKPVGSKPSSPSHTPRPSRDGIWSPDLNALVSFMGGSQSPSPAITRPNRTSVRAELPGDYPGKLRDSISMAWRRGGEIAVNTRLGDGGESIAKEDAKSPDDDTPPTTHLRNSSTSTLNCGDEEDSIDNMTKKYAQVPHDCSSRADVRVGRRSWLSIWILLLSLYSTVLSAMWLMVAIVQPRWGRRISSTGALLPSTASLLTALFAKTIELSFVTVFVTFVGQVLTRRAFVKQSKGMTLSEMTMRNWVVQPGSLLTHGETIQYSALTFLGGLSLIATAVAMLYTTASDAMVSPKLRFSNWEPAVLQSYIVSSYANPFFVKDSCTTPFSSDPDNARYDEGAGYSCLDVQYSGNCKPRESMPNDLYRGKMAKKLTAYHNLMAYMSTWHDISINGTSSDIDISQRPPATASLYDNTTLTGAWIETENSNTTKNFETHQRIINNVTLAIPHPGVYDAATNPINNILQPSELSGVGEYSIKASVVSPAVNVMCVNMRRDELVPLVYTEWPNAKTNATNVGNQTIGYSGWQTDVPIVSSTEWLNETVVDDIFHWGEAYGRRPPVFQLFPINSNIITNTSVLGSDAIYIFGKSRYMANYTLCELRSWTTPKCSTQFNISGTTGAHMAAHCEDPSDTDSFQRSFPNAKVKTSKDWKNMVDQWRISIDLNGGVSNNNASNARILTELALTEPQLASLLPSMAEALAVMISSTLVTGAVKTPFRPGWDYSDHELGLPGKLQSFNASLMTQEYTSSHSSAWQGIFYIILVLVFLINVLCFVYFIIRSGLVTDFTEPANLFALAINSPPSMQLKGSCGGGAEKRDLVVPYRVSYTTSANHYFFEEANDRPWRGKYMTSSVEYEPGNKPSSFNRLSASRSWF